MRLFIILFVLTSVLHAQSSGKGSITLVDGTTQSGYIIDFDKTDEISTVQFKKSNKEATESFTSNKIKEVTIKKKKYIIAQVQIDNRSNNLSTLRTSDRNKDFHFSEKTIALEILEDGEATLYRTYLGLVEKFFYSTANQPITQLLYKKYFLPRHAFYIGSDGAAQNKEYLKQLYKDVKCITKKGKLFYPDFDKPSLKKYFERYNEGKCL